MRKPAAKLELAGAFKKNPARARRDVAAVGKIGRWPRAASTDPAIVWGEICRSAPPGLLKAADSLAVELAVRLIVQMRADAEGLTAAKATAIANLLDRLGLTPRARTQIDAPAAPPKESVYAEFRR